MHWDSTTLVVVEVPAGGQTGLGYTYTHGSIVKLIESKLAEQVKACDALDPPAAWRAMQRAVRNMGREGLAATAISAVDTALWDLKAKLLDLPLCLLFGRFREDVPIYGSGGFTTYSDDRLREQLSGWVRARRLQVGEDEGRHASRAAIRTAWRWRSERSATACCSSTATAPTTSSRRCCWRREFAQPGRGVVRGTGVLRRPGRPAAAAAACAGLHGDRRRRVRLHRRLFPPHAECRRGGCAAGGRDALHGLHRLAAWSPACARRITSTCPAIAARRCICTPPVPRRASVTWSGFTTTFVSNTCCSMARRHRATV